MENICSAIKTSVVFILPQMEYNTWAVHLWSVLSFRSVRTSQTSFFLVRQLRFQLCVYPTCRLSTRLIFPRAIGHQAMIRSRTMLYAKKKEDLSCIWFTLTLAKPGPTLPIRVVIDCLVGT